MNRPLILVSNDDGISAPGIRALIDVVSEIGDVVVVAPDGNVWVGLYAGSGRQEILANGATVHYKGIYVLDPVTMDHVSIHLLRY